ncbi:hypothetical protein Pint_20507 [Pistacia integerrima]|uniref:Uncharacterized protein n=1 Tax=Pistacia integerrima TaxID=434235 RepID=A0ACC0XBC7_9ROSI|nr:hypothetical protein Pint_20507 [Pistacia integerrima]
MGVKGSNFIIILLHVKYRFQMLVGRPYAGNEMGGKSPLSGFPTPRPSLTIHICLLFDVEMILPQILEYPVSLLGL